MINVRNKRDLSAEWRRLVKLEPALAELAAEARAYAAVDRAKRQLLRYETPLPAEVWRWAAYECANHLWYRPFGLKARLTELVGWAAQKPELRTQDAYDLAYEYLYRLLPDCRNCGCGW